MKRTAILRRKPMRSTRCAEPAPTPRRRGLPPKPSAVCVQRGAVSVVSQADARPVPKDDPLQHGGYMALVRKLACAHCGWPPPSQFCHADAGKGTGLKTDCRRGYPGCGPHRAPSGETVAGCHWLIGSSGRIPKLERRDLEEAYGQQTRAAIESAGNWPARLPRWADS